MVGLGRREVAIVLGLAVAAAVLASRPLPAAPAPVESDTLVFAPEHGGTFGLVRNGVVTYADHFGDDHLGWAIEGDFTSAPGTDIFMYGYRSEPDGVVTITPDGTSVTTSLIPKTVNLDYGPLVGDYDGNGVDDILWVWNGPGYGSSLWLFNGNGSHRSVPITAPLGDSTVFDANGDGFDDVLWYQPGSAPDRLWLFGPGAIPIAKPVTINGAYDVIAGHFGDQPEGSPQDRLVFFSDGGYDSIWTFDTMGDHVAAPLPAIDDVYEPVVGRFTGTTRDAIYWYRPGHDAEQLWTFSAGGAVADVVAPTIFGTYRPAVGDFDGNGYQDIAWTSAQGAGTATIWRFYSGGHAQSLVSTGLDRTSGQVGHTDPADL